MAATSWLSAGHTAQGTSIRYCVVGSGANTTLVLGAMHGDETGTSELVERLAAYLVSDSARDSDTRVVLVPCVNPDGRAAHTRTNANGVDLNRNFPTADWPRGQRNSRYDRGSAPASEPETRAIIELVEMYGVSKVVTVHAPLRQLNYDGPAHALACTMASYSGYSVTSDVGYPTPGSFGTWAGKEGGIPVITLELGAAPFDVTWTENRSALLAAVRFRMPAKVGPMPGFTIEVDKTRDSLFLWSAGRRLRAYPVSTGFNGLPYNGGFRVVFKHRKHGWAVVNDTWTYLGNRPAEKELGHLFLGINSQHKATKRRLGIHGTDREDLIGQRVSKGCVRMRNKDVEELCAVVPEGTVVRVR